MNTRTGRGRSGVEHDPQFTVNRAKWLLQVARDGYVKGCSSSVAILLAHEYLNRETGDAWPSLETLASQLGRDPKNVSLALKSLKERGHLHVKRGGQGRPNRYKIRLKGASDLPYSELAKTPAQEAAKSPIQESTQSPSFETANMPDLNRRREGEDTRSEMDGQKGRIHPSDRANSSVQIGRIHPSRSGEIAQVTL